MAGYKGLNSTGKSTGVGALATTLREFVIADTYNTGIGNGDPVKLNATGTIELAALSDSPIGVLRGVRYVDSTGAVVFRRNHVAGTSNTGLLTYEGGETGNIVATVEMAEDRTFFIDASDGTVTQSAIGATYTLKNVGTTANAYGDSLATVDISTAVGTNTRLVRVLGIASFPGNALGATDTTLEVEFVTTVGDATQ